MRRLFDEHDNWTPEAQEISRKFGALIDPFVQEMAASGVSFRDLELIMVYDANQSCISARVALVRQKLHQERKR